MSRVLLQPKIYQLRLNLEQVQHTTDGWVENRRRIADHSLPLYDSQMEDIFDQFRSQGIQVHLSDEHVETVEQEVRQALALIEEMKEIAIDLEGAMNSRTQRHQSEQAYLIQEKLNQLRILLVGENYDAV